MAEMKDLFDTKQFVEDYISKMNNGFEFSSDIFFPESPNSKLQIHVKHGESIILEMSYWQNDQCRCEAVDLDKALLIFEDEVAINNTICSGEFMCKKVKIFYDYVLQN